MPTLGETLREFWSKTTGDADQMGDFCGTVADNRYDDYVSAQFLDYAHNTPGVDMPEPPGDDATEEQQEEYEREIAEAVSGVADAFVLYLAKWRNVPWLIEQLQKYQKEQENEGSCAGGEQG